MTEVGTPAGLGRTIDLAAVTFFAGAAGYSSYALGAPLPAATAVAAAGFFAGKVCLGAFADAPRFILPLFEPSELETAGAAELPELLLTEPAELLLTNLAELLLTDRLAPGPEPSELLLEDRLPVPAHDSRVIRLFDPRTLPTAGEMHERIERHLRGPQPTVYPDATGELHQALAALRKSLH
jgi:hypothetical protein